jgi:hypothetical protein
MNPRLLDNKPDSNRETIELYLVSDTGAIELNDKQKELLDRWMFTDEQIRKHEMTRETLAKLIMHRFKVSRITAYQDIVNTEAVFASSTPLNKKYRIQLRIEFIEMKISELYGMCRMDPEDEEGNKIPEEEEDVLVKISRIKNNQEYLHEAKELEKVLQKYYHDYPDIQPARAPRKIVYNILFSKMPEPKMTVEDAMQAAGRILNIKPNDQDGAAK